MPQLYAKVFTQILDSSLADDYQTRHVFMDILLLAENGILDMTREAISRRTNIPIDVINSALDKLEAPDPSSRDAAEQGKRLIRLDDHRDWGWELVNWERYEAIKSVEDRRERDRKRKRAYRDQRKETPSPSTPFPNRGEERRGEGVGQVRTRPTAHGTCPTPDGTKAEPPPPPSSENSGPKPTQMEDDTSVTNRPTVENAIKYFGPSRYTEDEVRACYLTFEASQGSDGSWWWGKRLVGDWRAAMESRMSETRSRKPNQPLARSSASIIKGLDNITKQFRDPS